MPALATAAIAASLFAWLGGGILSGPSGSAEAQARATLLRSAVVVGAGDMVPTRPPREDEYLYTRIVSEDFTTTDNDDGEALFASVPTTHEVWVNRDGVGWEIRRSGAPRFATQRDRSRWIEAGRPALGIDTNGPILERHDRPPMESFSLPKAPDDLYAQITDNGRAPAVDVFDRLREALTLGDMTPAQRAALYEVALRLPNVEVVDRVKDPAGRIGTGVAIENSASTDRERVMFVFDPRTGALLAEQSSALEDNAMDYPAGTPTGMITYTRVAVVDHVRERPSP